MSQANVAIVRAVYERWSDGDFRAHIDLLDPHVVLVLGPDFPNAGMHSGIEAVTAYTRDLLEPWTHFTMEAEEIVGAGDSVLAGVRQYGVGRSSGVPTVLHYFTIWTFRGGKVIHLESFLERAEALEALGLSKKPMAQDNVEVIRATVEAWNAGDMNALGALYDPDIVVRYAEGWPEGSEPIMGREAVVRQWEQQREPFESDTIELIDCIDAGDRVVVRQLWRAEGSGPDLSIEVSSVSTMRKGKMILMEFFWDHAEALEAVGLSEQNDRPTASATLPAGDKIRIINSGVEAMNARKVDEALFTDDFEIVNVSNALTDKTYRGASGAREWMHDFFDVLDEKARFEVTEIVEDREDYLVVRNRLVGTASASGVPFDMQWFSAWWFRNGRAARTVGYNSRRAALAAVHGDAPADS